MLKKIKSPQGLLKNLIKRGIVHSVYSRSLIRGYYDLAPSFHSKKLEEIGINSTLHIGGKGFTKEDTIISCAGEIIERISLMREFDLSPEVHKFRLTDFFSNKELKKNGIKKYELLQGIKVKRYDNGKDFIIPELFLIPNSKKRKLPKFSNSIGCSFNKTLDKAIFGSLLEIIERHSLLKAWYRNKKLNKINIEDKNLIELVEKFKGAEKISIDFYIVPSKIPCNTICCKISFQNKTVFGCSSSLDPLEASYKSLAEALQLYTSSSHIPKRKKEILEKRFAKLIRSPLLRFSEKTARLPKRIPKEKLMKFFKKNKFNVYYVDVTHQIFKDMGYVVKVFCPSLLQFPTTDSLTYKKNQKIMKKDKEVNPFV